MHCPLPSYSDNGPTFWIYFVVTPFEMMVFYASFVHIVYAKLGQADAGDNEAKLMTKFAPEWVRTSDPVIRSPACYRWTTAPASHTLWFWQICMEFVMQFLDLAVQLIQIESVAMEWVEMNSI